MPSAAAPPLARPPGTKHLALLLLTWLACLFPGPLAAGNTADRQVALIHLNDLHAHLVPRKNLVRTAGQDGAHTAVVAERGGLARLATALREIRGEFGSSVLMNVGDTYHGGVEALYTRGNAIVPPVDALGIDIAVPGNWDFAYGPIVTRLRYSPDDAYLARLVNRVVFGEAIEVPAYPFLGGNVYKSIPVIDRREPLLPATRIMAVGGLRIGFIGITSDIVPRMSPMLGLGFEFLEGEAAYRDYIDRHAARLRESGVDLVVVLSELGLHKDRQLANTIRPGVDVFFSGHTHELTEQPLTSRSGALVVESGDESTLGVMLVTLDGNGRKRFEWRLRGIDDKLQADERIAALVRSARAPFLSGERTFKLQMPAADMSLAQRIDTVIGAAPGLLHRRNALANPFNRFLSDNLREFAGTDLAITPGFRFDAVLEAGDPVTVEDSYRYLPIPPELATATVRAEKFRELLEFELERTFARDPFQHSGGWLVGLGGLHVTIDLAADYGARVLEMKLQPGGEVITPGRELTVVSCSRAFDPADALCGIRGFEDIAPLAAPGGGAWTARDFLQWSLAHGARMPAPDSAVTDVSGTPLWPLAPWVQPLW